MEKFLLGLLLAGDELHVVHQKQRGLPVFLPELCVLALPDGGYQLVGEVVALDVNDLGVGMVFLKPVGNGIEQVGFSQARIAVDEQRIVVHARPLGHGVGGSVGQFIAGPYHIGLKGEGPGIVQVPRIVRRHAVVGRQLFVVEDLDLKVSRKQIPQGIPDVGKEPGLDGFLLKFVAAVQHKGGILHGHHLHLVEPGVDGGGGQLPRHLLQHIAPYIGQ